MSDENINICINVVTKKSITEAGNKLETLGKQGADAGKKIEQSIKRAQSGIDQIKNAGAFAAGGLAILTAAAVKSLGAFKAFENGLINVEKVTNISGKNLASFGKEIDRLANRIPVGTSELLNISQTAGQLGIEGSKNILAFTESLALLTRTTDLTVDSARSLAQLIAVSGTAPENIGRLSAVIVSLGNNFSATESQILEVSTRIAQSTTQYNLLAEDAVKLGAIIAGVGEKAEASGTAIGKTFRALEGAIISGGAPLEQLIKLTGLQREELSNLFKTNPTELLRKFTEGLGKAKKAGELIPTILSDFGLKTDRVNRVLGPLIKNTENVARAFKLTEEEMTNQSAAIEEARKQFKSLESAEILTKNATIELSKTLGRELEPAYRSVLEFIRTTALATTRFVEDNNRGIKVVLGAISGLTVAFGSLAIAATAAWLGITGPIGLAVAGFGILGSQIAAVIIYWEEITEVIEGAKFLLLAFIEIAVKSFSKLPFLTDSARKSLESLTETIKNEREEISKNITERRKEREEKQKAIDIDNTKREKLRELEQAESDLTEAVKKGNVVNDAAALKDLASIRERILVLRGLGTEATTVEDIRIQKINELQKTYRELEATIDNASSGNRANIIKELELIDQKITKIKEEQQSSKNEKELSEKEKRAEKLLEAEQSFLSKIERLNRVANNKSTDGIRDVLIKQREEKLKSLRQEAIDNGDFSSARNVELKLDEVEKERIEKEARDKRNQRALDDTIAHNEKLAELKQQVSDLEAEQVILEVESQLETDEQELELIQTRLDNIQILKLQAQQKEAEAEGNHLQALRKQREIDAIKQDQFAKVRSDASIRRSKAKAQVETLIAQTTSQQLIGIGDNLMKAGIIQGKTAGKALKALKTGEAIVNTYTGATLALSKYPGPIGILAAAGVVATGLGQVAQIQAQKFATGGVVQAAPSGSRGIDNVPALLSVGEEVLTKNNPRHRDNISKESDQAMIEELKGLRADIQNMQTIVTIDGKEVADVIQEQRFRGVR